MNGDSCPNCHVCCFINDRDRKYCFKTFRPQSTRPLAARVNAARAEAQVKHIKQNWKELRKEQPTPNSESGDDPSVSQSERTDGTYDMFGSSSAESSSEEDPLTWNCLTCGCSLPERVRICRQCWTARPADTAVQSRAAKGVRGRHEIKKE